MRPVGPGSRARGGSGVTRPRRPCSCGGDSAPTPCAAHRGSSRGTAAAGRSPRGGARSCSGAGSRPPPPPARPPAVSSSAPAAQVRPRPALLAPPVGPCRPFPADSTPPVRLPTRTCPRPPSLAWSLRAPSLSSRATVRDHPHASVGLQRRAGAPRGMEGRAQHPRARKHCRPWQTLWRDAVRGLGREGNGEGRGEGR